MNYITNGILAVVLGIVGAFVLRAVLHRLNANNERGAVCNIRSGGRFLRFGIGAILLVAAWVAGWSPLLLFFAGFSFAEAFLGWCAVVAFFTRG